MEDFRNKFIEEANDLINALENAVLRLEGAPQDEDLVNEVFRIMHSLKGGGAMFGFDKISDFTHNLENIYDEIRTGKKQTGIELLNATFESVDHLRNLLKTDSDPEVMSRHAELSKRIAKLVSADEMDADDFQDKILNGSHGTSSQIIPKATYYIYFKPNSDIFDNGTNPLFLLDDIRALGDCKVFAHTQAIPSFGKFDFTVCYTYWEVLLETKESVLEINDVFMFAEDECTIEIKKIGDWQLVSNQDYLNLLEKSKPSERFDYQTLKALAQNLAKPKTSEKQQEKKVSEKIQKFAQESEITSIRIATEKIDQYMNLVSELVTAQAALKMHAAKNKDTELIAISETLENITEQIRDNALSISLIPVENTVTRFRRLVRDLSTGIKKDIDFITEGTDTRIDKTLLQIITDPLMHIIRNSIDHGLETPAERIAAGKPEQGKIILRAYYSGSNVHIDVEDDGKGVDTEKVQKKAIERGLISNDVHLTKEDALKIIFMPGFSTADKVTDISGRGVGMDVLKRKIADVRGDIEIKSEKGQGTRITLKLPLTLSIIDGLLVTVGASLFVVPLTSVARIRELKYKNLTNKYQNILVLDGEQIPFYFLRDELQIGGEYPEEVNFVIVKYENTRVGIVFDTVIGEYQAVLKPLGKLYRKHDIITGASILGDGNVALVLDTNKIIKKFSSKEEI